MQQSVRLKAFLLSVIFMLTGVAIALPGAVLPAMLQEWGMSDRRGGVLLLLAWSGSTSGILFTRGDLEWSVVRGAFLTTVAMAGLAVIGRPGAMPLFALYGVGLGVTMTSISILRSKQIEDEGRTQELNRLNMLWAVGACIAPWVALRAVRTMHVAGVFATLGIAFAVVLAGLLAMQWRRGRGALYVGREAAAGAAHVPVLLCLFAALAVGVESSLGGWLTTFAGRTTHAEGLAVSANSVFWAGLLISRAAHASPRWQWLKHGPGLPVHGISVVIATAWLLREPQGAALLFVALLAGLGLGPMYPLALSIALPRYRPEAIFLMAGAGSAVFPWVTGMVSTRFGSLGTGLMVPCAAAVALVAIGLGIGQRPVTASVDEPAR